MSVGFKWGFELLLDASHQGQFLPIQSLTANRDELVQSRHLPELIADSFLLLSRFENLLMFALNSCP